MHFVATILVATEHTLLQYVYIPTQQWCGNIAIWQPYSLWQYCHIATIQFVTILDIATHVSSQQTNDTTMLLIAITVLATISCLRQFFMCIAKTPYCNTTSKRMQDPIAPFQMQPLVNDHTQMQLICIATKIAILQPNIGVTTRLDPSTGSQ